MGEFVTEYPLIKRMKRVAQLRRKKERFAQERFLVEGPHAVAEALEHCASDIEIIYATPEGLTRAPVIDRLADKHKVVRELVNDRTLDVLADTVTPQGVVAVVRMHAPQLSVALRSPRLVAVMHEVRDPGNAGTVIRGADAAGADAVVLTGDSVDPWHPKVVRASTGSLFHLPVLRHRQLEEVLDVLHEKQVLTLAADLQGDPLDPNDSHLSGPVAWVFGNEARGLDAADAERCRERKRLPMFGATQSLNLATAATVCLYTTAFTQRQLMHNR